MRWTINNPLDEYQGADFTKRLHLYLQHRELRSEFMEIDRHGLPPGTAKSRPRHKCFSMIRGGTLPHLTDGCMKRLFGMT